MMFSSCCLNTQKNLLKLQKMTTVCVDTSGLDEGGLVIVYFVYSGKPRGVDSYTQVWRH